MSIKALLPPVVVFTSVAALAVAVVAQTVGSIPVTFQAPAQVGSSQTTLRLSPGLQILAAEPLGTSQLAVRMAPFTSIDQASRLGDLYGMGLVGASPAFGRYVFSLPQIVVEQGSTRDTATVYFPPRATAAQIAGYLAANRLTVRRWYRPEVGVEDQGRIALVSLPRITPVLVDAAAGIWKAIIPANLDAATLASWAAGAAIHIVSYDPPTGTLLIKGPAAVQPVYRPTPAPIVRRVTHITVPAVVPSPPAQDTPVPVVPQVFVTFAPDTTSSTASATILQAGGQMVSFDTTTEVAVVNVANANQTALTTVLSAQANVTCVKSTAAPCTPTQPVTTPAPIPAATTVVQPVALRILPDTGRLTGTVILSADVQTGDGAGQVAWTLSGPLASVAIGTSSGTPLAGSLLSWTATLNFDSTTVSDGSYTLTIRIQDGSGNVTVINRPVVVSNAKPAQPVGFAAAAATNAVALTWQQPATGNAALYRITRDGVQLVELPAGSTSYTDATAASGSHTYALVVVDQSSAVSDPVTTTFTVAAPVTQTAPPQVIFVVRLAGGDLLAADGLAGGHLILSASTVPATALTFEYTSDGTTWTPVPATVTCASQCTADWNLAGLSNGHYRVRATGNQLVSDEAGFIVAATPALPAPTALVSTATTFGVDLHWAAPAGVMPAAYLVSRQSTGDWSPLATTAGASYTDASATAGATYSYRVQATGSDGSSGAPSAAVSITLRGSSTSTAATPVLAAPAGVRVVDGSGGSTVLWQAVPGATGYIVERALDSAGTFEPLPAVATTLFKDSALRVGGQVYYRVRALAGSTPGDASLVVASISLPGPAAATTPAPFVVASPSAQPTETSGELDLRADQATSTRAGSSVVVRAAGSDAGVDRAALQKLSGSSWLTFVTLSTTVTPDGWTAASPLDLSGVAAGDLQVRAVAQSASGAQLGVTAPGRVTVIHSAPAPAALHVASSGSAVSVSWTPPASSAPLTYSVYRAAGSGGYTLAASGLTTPAFDDRFLRGNVRVSYVVTASDDLGNQSTWSAPAQLVTPAAWSQAAPTIEFVLPGAGTLAAGETALLQAAAGGPGGITSFSFAYAPQGSSLWVDIPGRSPIATGGPDLNGMDGLATWAAPFKTTGLALGNYTIRATATDALGHSADVLRTLTVTASQPRGPPATAFTLNATAVVGAVHLAWNAAGASYQIERSTDGAAGPFKAIGITTSNSFDDSLLIPGFAYAYRVVELGSGSATSSTATATPLAIPSTGTSSPDQQLNVSAPGQLSISVAPASLPSPMQAGLHAYGVAYEVDATSLGSGAQVHLLDQAATLTFTLPAGLSAAQAAGLSVYHWDTARGVWVVEPSSVDLATGRIVATVSHFSTFALATSADLALTMTGPATVNAGANLTYLVTITNNGPNDATTLNLPIPPPAFTSFVSFLQTAGTTFSGTLPALTAVTFAFSVKVGAATPPGTLITNTMTVSAATSDPDLTNNSATVTTTVNGDAPITPTAVPVSAAEGAAFSGSLVTFQDDDANGSASLFAATINWGDNTAIAPGTVATTAQPGFAVSGTHTFIEEGSFTITLTISDADGTSATGSTTATVQDASLAISSQHDIAADQGVAFSGLLVQFTDANPNATLNDFTATINWGDATTSAGVVAAACGGTCWTLSGAHTYANLMTGTAVVTISDTGGASAAATLTLVVGPPITFIKTVPFSATEGATATAFVADVMGGIGQPATTIDWGDGSPTSIGTLVSDGATGNFVQGTHAYAEEGPYTIHVTATDGMSTASANAAATVTDAQVIATPTAVNATEGTPFNGLVATFTDADPSETAGDYTITINWGDGVQTAGTAFAQGSAFNVTGSHVYSTTGNFNITVTVQDPGGSSSTVVDAATVSDAPLNATGVNVATTEGATNFPTAPPTFHGVVATFTDANIAAAISDFNATIDWGDGTSPDAGAVASTGPGAFSVTGSHTYLEEGSYAIVVAISDVAGPTALPTSTATVADAPVLSANPASPLTVTQGVSFTAGLAGFAEANYSAIIGDWSATIDWGDGTSSAGTMSQVGPQTFGVSGTHIYQAAGTFSYTVTFVDVGGTTGHVTGAVTVQPATADLELVKTGPATANEGGNVSYSLTLTNHGPADALNVVLSDTVPAGLTWQNLLEFSGPAPTYGFDGTHVTASWASLASGTVATFTINFGVNAGSGGTTVTNTASVSSTTFDPNPNNNSSSVSTVIQGADLELVKTGPATANEGGNVSYSLTLTNHGPADALNVVLSDTVPAGLTWQNLLEFSGPAPTYGFDGTHVTASWASLASGTVATFTINFGVNAGSGGTTVTNTASVSSTTFDPNPNNNSSSVSTVIQGADLELVKTGPATANEGGNVSYSLTLTNHGPADALNVVLSDTVPAGLTWQNLLEFSGPAPTYGFDGTHVTASWASLASGTVATFTINFGVNAGSGGTTVTNTASVSSTTFDPNPNNNSSSVSTAIQGADLELVKTGPATANEGGNVSYSLTLTNHGPADALNVVLSDTVPAGLTWQNLLEFSGPAPTYGFDGTHVTASWASLASGTVATFTINFGVNAGSGGTTVTNTASVSSTTFDPNPNNNSSSATIDVRPVTVDLAVTFTGPGTAVEGVATAYTVTVDNLGPDTATSVVFGAASQVPGGAFNTVATTSSSSPGVSCGGFQCNLASLLAGASASLTLNLTFSLTTSNVAGSDTVNVFAQGHEFDPNLMNNAASLVINVRPVTVDLAVTFTGPGTAVEGVATAYTVTVDNLGPDTATSVVFGAASQVPGGAFNTVATTSSSSPGVSCSGIQCNLASLLAGASASLTLNLTFSLTTSNVAGSDTVNVFAQGHEFDPNLVNNAASLVINVRPVTVDLAVTFTGPGTAVEGVATAYTVTVDNLGPDTATSVVFGAASQVPGGAFNTVATASSSSPGVSCSGFQCNLASLLAGASASLTLNLTFSLTTPNVAGSDTVNVFAQGHEFDPNLVNNAASLVINVRPVTVDLAVTFTGPGTAVEGVATAYTVTVDNLGPDTATSVVFGAASQVPGGAFNTVATTSSSSPGVSCSGIQCNLASLLAGASASLTLNLTFSLTTSNVAGSDTINVFAQGHEFDPNLVNNAASLVINVVPNIVVTVPTLHAFEGAFSGVVATFTADASASVSQFAATITWDDGSSSAGVVSALGSGFAVSATHTFIEEGTFPISAAVQDGSVIGSAAGTAVIADAALTASGASINSVEGQLFSGIVGSFADANLNAPATDFTVTINWGDNTSLSAGTVTPGTRGPGGFVVNGAHTYGEEGSYSATIAITDVGGSTASATATAAVADAFLTASPANVAATEGGAFSGVVATFTDTNPNPTIGDFAATINWGDSTPSSSGVISAAAAGGFSITGSHAYGEEGSYAVNVFVTDLGGSSFPVTSTATVSDTALSAAGTSLTATEGAPFSGPVATFTDANPNGTPADFTALVTFGDGSTSTGTVVANGTGGYTIYTAHTFVEEGSNSLSISITDAGGSTAIATSSATVADAALSATSLSLTATEGAAFNGAVATFTDANPNGTPADFTALVNFGDGSTSTGTVVANGTGGYTVFTAHTYVEEGSNSLSISITDAGGSTAIATSAATVADAALSATGLSLTVAKGAAFTGAVATFTDADPNGLPSDYVATINWGDGISSTGTVAANASGGFSVAGTHTYAEEGSYVISISITDAGGSTAIATSSATVADAALSAAGLSLTATEGAAFTGAVATFTDSDPNGIAADYVASINWGDGASSTGAVTANSLGTFTVSGSHVYGEEGSFVVSVQVNDAGGSSTLATSAATVADSALTATGRSLTATEGAAFTGAVATFTDADPNGIASDYVATINWGDGSSSTGTVAANASGGFSVSGAHTYAEEGGYLVSVTIKDASSSATAGSSVAVADASLKAHGVALPATRFTGFSGVVATFTDADPAGLAGDYVATINWGDGTTSVGVVAAQGAGFAVSGSHTFGEGMFAITTLIADAGGATAVATSTITVDLTAPVTTASSTGRFDDGWFKAHGVAVLTLTATDNLTGVAATYFTVNGGAPRLYTGRVSFGPGRYVIRYWSVDGVGNVEKAHTIRIKVVHTDRDQEMTADEEEVSTSWMADGGDSSDLGSTWWVDSL